MKSMLAVVAKKIFVGLPMTNINDQVFAAVNSAIKYGSGLMCVLLQKKQMNGVNVRMTTSFDVNIVNPATNAYKEKNKTY